jgi:hypothetical protein
VPTQPSITANVHRFRETKSVRVLIELMIQIVRQKRAVELIYGGYCTVWHRPSAVYPCDDEETLTRILSKKYEFIRDTKLSRGQLTALYGDNIAIHDLPDDFPGARRESVWLNDTCLILGEYGESARIACITARACVISDYYRHVAGVRHIHSIQRYGDSGEFLVSTGDGRKFLDVWVASRGDIRFVRRLRRRLAGFTAAVEVNGQYYFGSDFSGRPNFIETLGGAKYFFPEKGYKLHVTGFHALFDRYIVSINEELKVSGGQKTLSVFDTLKQRFVFCDYLDLTGTSGRVA